MKRTPLFYAAIFSLTMIALPAQALELDWSGQFRSEFHFIHNYNMDGSNSGVDPSRIISKPGQATGSTVTAPGGYYIPPGGSSNATFETLFLKLQPKVVVNDNIAIKSELWAGSPSYGAFGDSYPQGNDQRQYYSTQSRGSVITAQRFWADLTTDFGVLTVGRAPLQWGLGVVWNAGDGPFDRFESTGDQIRLNAKFGSFTFSPGMAVYSTGNIFGGNCTFTGGTGTNTCSAVGGGGLNDYFVQLKYENLEDEFEGGVNFIRRVQSGGQDAGTAAPVTADGAGGALNPTVPWNTQVPAGMAYNTWDIYMQKKLGKFRLAAEAPVTSGQINGASYSTFAIASEADWRINDPWEMRLRAGRAPGQPDSAAPSLTTFNSFFFNPDYQIATILFNYNLVNLGGYFGPNTLNNPAANSSNLRSPFDNPITDATYVNWTGLLHADKWTFTTGFVWAKANQTAKIGDAYFFNNNKRALEQFGGTHSQGSNLGIEWDTSMAFQWDESFLFKLEWGMLFPGAYYAFSNTSTDNATNMIYAAIFHVGVKF